jgi:hypothetical protein
MKLALCLFSDIATSNVPEHSGCKPEGLDCSRHVTELLTSCAIRRYCASVAMFHSNFDTTIDMTTVIIFGLCGT